MQAAKEAIHHFTSKKGHDTTVHEAVSPAVTKENVRPHQHEETTQAVDREVHQDHHHTTVQPISHQETLPEKHTHNLVPTEHREIHHEDPHHSKEQAAAQLAQFQPGSTTHQTTRSAEAQGAVTGEHVHHHVHETVVPVVHKDTVQPEVVHTTQPIHEVHHAPSQHHGISALPMKSLDEFKSAGGALGGGSGPVHEHHDGPPRPYNDKLSTTMDKLGFTDGASRSAPGHGTANVGAPTAGGAGAGTGAGAGAGVGAGAGAGGGAVAAANAAMGNNHGHPAKDSGVGRRQRSGSASSSDYEYAADGTKVTKNRLARGLHAASDGRNV